MKKLKLFLAATAAMVGLSAQAQLTNGTVYWIQDTGSGQFISQGGNWGTQATVQDVGGLGWETVYVSDGVYKLKNIMWNKVNNTADLGLNIVEHDGYCDQAASEITLTASGEGYLLSAVNGSDTRYIINNQSVNDYGVKGLGFTTNSSEATVWKFLTKSQYVAALQAYKDDKAASYATALGHTAANVAALEAIINDNNQYISKDYTSSITNAELNAGNTNGWTATKPNQRDQAFSSENGTMAEAWNGCVVATQTVSNLPNGIYKVSFVGTFRPKGATEAERLTSEQTSSPAYVFANDSKEEFIHWIDVAAKANVREAVKNNATAYSSSFYTYVTDGTLNLGVKQDTWYDGNMWCPFGYFTLTYYTDQVSDEDIAELVSTIPAEDKVPASVYSNLASLKSTLESAKTIAAFNNLSNAITVANALVAPYATLLMEISKAKALGIAAADAEAYANVTTADEATANTQSLMVDEYNYVATTFNYAVELGAWNASDNAGTMSSQHWDGTSTSTYLEQGAGDKAYSLSSWTVTYDQNLDLPAGNYVFKVAGRTASDHVTINLNVTNVSNSNELLGNVNDFPKGDTGLGINKAGATSFDPADEAGFANNGIGRGWQWRYVRFTLTEPATVNVAVVATADAQYRWMGFCNATVQTDNEANVSLIAYNVALNNAQTILADATYENVAGTDKSNLQAAIAADASLDKTDADAIDAATEALNTAVTTFTTGVASWNSLVATRAAASGELPYASASKKTALDNAVAAEVTGTAEDAANQVAVIEQANRQYVESNALAEGVDGAVNVTNLITNPDANDGGNGWSGDFGTLDTEQYTQGDGSLGGAYFDKNGTNSYTAEQTITNLAAGKYLLTVTARAQSISGTYQVKATNSRGDVSTANVATIGNQGGVFGRGFSDSSVEFLQTYEGNATIGITATNEGNFWMSFDRFRLVKLRDLTPEEMAVIPTAIALYNGETEVTETIALDATTNTVTLTPSFTPADATNTVTWTTSDASVATVANGVVTAVSPGTATITVTSTLDATVSATATVTVSFPETEIPASTFTNDGATRTIATLGENLIVNGSFEYPDGFYGWTDATAGAAKLTSSNFDIVTEGENKYLKSKNHGGSTAASSIGTAWPIEAGKTYVFGYKAKAVNAGTTEYHVVSLTNTLATETSKISTTQTVGTDWTDIKYTFTNTDNYTYLQFRARWLGEKGQLSSFDDFYLCEASTTIEGNVDYATAAIPTANIGTGAFQYSQDAIDAANALVQGTATVEEVQAAYDAVITLNAPDATQAYNLVFNCEGHSATGNALTLIPNPAQTQGLYGLKYLTPANVNLAQAFYFTHTSGNKYKVHAIDTDLNERYITTQAEGYGTTWYDGIRTIDDESKAMEIEIRPNGEGLYLLWNTGANKPLAHNGNSNNDLFTNNTANFQFVETTKPSIAINTTAAGWGTTMLPFAVTEIPEGVTVYSCAAVEGSTLTLKEVASLEANKPYIIEGAWEATLTGDAQGTALEYTEGLLTGTYVTLNHAKAGTYIMQKQNDKVGFYQVDLNVAQPKLAANRAYLTVPATDGGVKAFFLGGGEDAIQSVFDGLVNGDAYDLGGRKVSKLQKGGVYIVNGKKVVVK